MFVDLFSSSTVDAAFGSPIAARWVGGRRLKEAWAKTRRGRAERAEASSQRTAKERELKERSKETRRASIRSCWYVIICWVLFWTLMAAGVVNAGWLKVEECEFGQGRRQEPKAARTRRVAKEPAKCNARLTELRYSPESLQCQLKAFHRKQTCRSVGETKGKEGRRPLRRAYRSRDARGSRRRGLTWIAHLGSPTNVTPLLVTKICGRQGPNGFL